MGTKIRANYHPVIDLDGGTSTALRSIYRENQITENGYNPEIYKNGCLGYETEKVKQTILEHESIFRNQLQELHRLYRRQRELMSEIKRRDVSKSSSLSYLSNMEKSMQERFSKLPVFENTSRFQASYDRHANSSLITSQCNNAPDALRFGFHFRNTNNNQNYLSISNPTGEKSANSEPRKDTLNFSLDLGSSVSRRKRKIFGVEIFEENDDTFEATNTSSTKVGKCVEVPNQSSESRLPWFLKNTQYSGESSNGTNSSYFMNMDSLQNRSENFFSKQKKEIPAVNEVNDDDGKKIFGFPISDMLKDLKSRDEGDNNATKVKSDEVVLQKGLNNYISDLKHHIDLNLTLDEEEEVPLMPTAVIKLAATEIDLEGPQHEADILRKDSNFIVPFEESDKIAAEVIIAISLSQEPHNGESIDRLKLLAEIISSQHEDNDKEEENIPIGMDYFEFMTLKLEDVKEKNYLYKPVILNPSDDETGSAKLPKRSRPRRGRQRKDFQRDILPGLVTLSRHEVTEDFQAFTEILKGEDNTGKSAIRNGRGRKRLGGTTIKAHCTTPKPVCQHEEKSLSGWGKKTRRLPRQRCNNSFLSFTVKC